MLGGSRLIVEEPVREAVVEKVAAPGRRLVPGDPLDPATRLGAIVDSTQLSTVLGYIESGREEGARLRTAANARARDSGGFYVEPTVFDQVRPDDEDRARGDLRAGAASDRVKDAEEAVAVGNSGIYGLAAAVWTRDISARASNRARAARRRRLRQLLRRRRHHGAVRRLQAVRHGPRQVAARLRQVHRAEDDLDRPLRQKIRLR